MAKILAVMGTKAVFLALFSGISKMALVKNAPRIALAVGGLSG